MRLSATERIIRQAEEDEADAHPAARNRRSLLPLEAPNSRPQSRPAEPTAAAVDIDMDIDIEVDSDGHDDEGETLVDVEKSAAALHKLRSYGGKLSGTGAPFDTGHAPAARALASAAPAPAAPRNPFAWSDVRGGASVGVLAGRPLPGMPLPTPASIALATDERSATAIPGAWADDVARRRHAVGRGFGLLIAAATAGIVALALGAWTGGFRRGIVSSDVVTISTNPHTRLSPVVVPTAPPSGPNGTEPVPSSPDIGAVAGEGSKAIPVSRFSPSSSVVRAHRESKTQPSSAAVRRAQLVHKRTPPRSRSRRETSPKAAVTTHSAVEGPAQPTRASPLSLPPRHAGRLPADPDGTLPFAE